MCLRVLSKLWQTWCCDHFPRERNPVHHQPLGKETFADIETFGHCKTEGSLDRTENQCPRDCSGNGFCDTGACYCYDGLFGLNCSQIQSAVSVIWVTEEVEYSLQVEWENPPTDVHYYKLKFRALVEMDEKQVMVPKSNDPKSRYILTGLKPGRELEVTVIPVKDNTKGKPSSVTGRTEIDSPSTTTSIITERF